MTNCGHHKFGSHLSPRSSHSDIISWVVTLWAREREKTCAQFLPGRRRPVPALELQPVSPEVHAHRPHPSNSPLHSQRQPSLSHHPRGFSFGEIHAWGTPETLTPGLFPPPLPPLLPEEELPLCSYKGRQGSTCCLPGTWQEAKLPPSARPPSWSFTAGSRGSTGQDEVWPSAFGNVG